MAKDTNSSFDKHAFAKRPDMSRRAKTRWHASTRVSAGWRAWRLH